MVYRLEFYLATRSESCCIKTVVSPMCWFLDILKACSRSSVIAAVLDIYNSSFLFNYLISADFLSISSSFASISSRCGNSNSFNILILIMS